MLIPGLHKRFRVDVVKAPSAKGEIEKLKQFSPIPIPDFFLGMIQHGSEYEILVDSKMYIRFWGAAGCLDMNSAYHIQDTFGSCLAIGDDEGGQAFILMPAQESYPAGLYLIDFACTGIKDGTYIAQSLEDLLINGIGAERIYNWWKL